MNYYSYYDNWNYVNIPWTIKVPETKSPFPCALKDLKNGTAFHIGEMQFFKVKDCAEGTMVVSKKLVCNMQFGDTDDFAKSDILPYLIAEILPKVECAVGAENVREFTVNLETRGCPNRYCDIVSKIAIPWRDFVDDNNSAFSNHHVDDWWWVCTGYGDGDLFAMDEREHAHMRYGQANDSYGVRPMLCLNPELIIKE